MMALSRHFCFVVLLAICVTAWGVIAEMPGQNAGHRNMATAPSNLQSLLEQREKAVWEAFKNKDRWAFADLITDDYTGVFADGQGERDRQSASGSMSQITVRGYSLSDFKLSRLGANAALLRYTASANFSLGDGSGRDSRLAVGDIWVKRGEQWQSLRYQETEMK
jgi:hypothetical protein